MASEASEAGWSGETPQGAWISFGLDHEFPHINPATKLGKLILETAAEFEGVRQAWETADSQDEPYLVERFAVAADELNTLAEITSTLHFKLREKAATAGDWSMYDELVVAVCKDTADFILSCDTLDAEPEALLKLVNEAGELCRFWPHGNFIFADDWSGQRRLPPADNPDIAA